MKISHKTFVVFSTCILGAAIAQKVSRTCTLDCFNEGVCRFSPTGGDSSIPFEQLNEDEQKQMTEYLASSTEDSIMSCECALGYVGPRCEFTDQTTTKCGDHVCLHGSLCLEDSNECDCESIHDGQFYAGEYCQYEATALCGRESDGSILFCVNSGECNEDGTACLCPDEFHGKKCELSQESQGLARSSRFLDKWYYILLLCIAGIALLLCLVSLGRCIVRRCTWTLLSNNKEDDTSSHKRLSRWKRDDIMSDASSEHVRRKGWMSRSFWKRDNWTSESFRGASSPVRWRKEDWLARSFQGAPAESTQNLSATLGGNEDKDEERRAAAKRRWSILKLLHRASCHLANQSKTASMDDDSNESVQLNNIQEEETESSTSFLGKNEEYHVAVLKGDDESNEDDEYPLVMAGEGAVLSEVPLSQPSVKDHKGVTPSANH